MKLKRSARCARTRRHSLQRRVLHLVHFLVEAQKASSYAFELGLVNLCHRHTALSYQHPSSCVYTFATKLTSLRAGCTRRRIRDESDIDVCRALTRQDGRSEHYIQVARADYVSGLERNWKGRESRQGVVSGIGAPDSDICDCKVTSTCIRNY